MKAVIGLVAFFLVLALSCPAMAIEADFSGEYRVEGIYNSNFSLQDIDESTSDAYLQMRLRLQPVFSITENLSLTLRLDGLDKRWGDDDGPQATSTSTLNNAISGNPGGTGSTDGTYPFIRTTTTIEEDDNIDLEWAYMTIKTGIGGFLVGRQRGNVWGTTFADTELPRDRITYVLPIQNTIIAAVYEKTREFDGNDLTTQNADMDKYYLTATQKGENFKAGFLYGFYDFATFQDMWQNTHTAFLIASSEDDGGYFTDQERPWLKSRAEAHLLIPYFDGKFGPLGVKAELNYATGTVDYGSPYRRWATDQEITTISQQTYLAVLTSTGDANQAATAADLAARGLIASGVENNEGKDSKDGDLLTYNLELSYDLGPFTFQAGYAYASGDADLNDDKLEAFGYIEPGEDWEKLAILTGTSYGLEGSLGGLGNLAGGGKANWDGYKLFYLGVDYDITDTMTIGLIYGHSKADEVTTASSVYSISQAAIVGNNNTWDDDHGSEYDLVFTWQIFDNLRYNFIAAYLDAGDYWKQGNPDVDLENNYLLWHRLTVEF